MATVEENIILSLNVKGTDNVIKQMKKTGEAINQSGKRMARQQVATNRILNGGAQQLINQVNAAQQLANKYDSFAGSMRLSLPQMKQIDAGGARMNTRMGRLGLGLRKATHGMRGFRMEMLGVMFFGMMLTRTFTGLLRPAMEAFGVFELWRVMLMMLFLPIMQEIFPYFLKFVEWFIDLPAPVKKIIGLFVLLAIAFGVVLMVVGQLALGIGSVILMGFLGLGPIILAVLAVIALVVLGVIALYNVWKNDTYGLRDNIEQIWGGIKAIFKGAFKAIEGFWNILVGFLTGDPEKIKAGLGDLAESAKLIFQGIYDIIIAIWSGIIKFVVGEIEAMFDGVFALMPEFIQRWYEFGKNIIKNFWIGVKDELDKHPLLKKILDSPAMTIMSFGLNKIAKELLKSDVSTPVATNNEYSTLPTFQDIIPSITNNNVTNNFNGFSTDEVVQTVIDVNKQSYDEQSNRVIGGSS